MTQNDYPFQFVGTDTVGADKYLQGVPDVDAYMQRIIDFVV